MNNAVNQAITHADTAHAEKRLKDYEYDSINGVLRNVREYDLFFGDNPYYRKNKFGIYQIRDDIKEARNLRFASIKELEALGLTPHRNNYELIYTAELPDKIEFLRDKIPALNRLYEQFNIAQPADYTGRSLSISDVIALRCYGDVSIHFVDDTGFIELFDFFKEQKIDE